MLGLHFSPADGDAARHLQQLLSHCIDKANFLVPLKRLQTRFDVYAGTCPQPLPATGLIVTGEIRRQSEIYLPLSEIVPAFCRLYREALQYRPILSSTPFYTALSWADVFSTLPQKFQFSPNPVRLLSALLDDRSLLEQFLFASFMPQRFYGASGCYGQQSEFVRQWLNVRPKNLISCLDAACGTGENTYELAEILQGHGYQAEDVYVEGWTREPLEVWCAAFRRFPHDPLKDKAAAVRREASAQKRLDGRIHFRCADLLEPRCGIDAAEGSFDLILCNGLLGGPIIHSTGDMDKVTESLTRLLAPGGLLLIDDRFHGGWKLCWQQEKLRCLFEVRGLAAVDVGGGFGVLKSAL
ncbi:MAG TPA: class I SAM-dependent methyltransferase [Desulfuromonadales bacterium]|nr:class I SAM-dependent methyltransferase [Desulfuromonadales bacterium]